MMEADSVSKRWLIVAKTPRLMSFLMTSGDLTSIFSASSRTVIMVETCSFLRADCAAADSAGLDAGPGLAGMPILTTGLGPGLEEGRLPAPPGRAPGAGARAPGERGAGAPILTEGADGRGGNPGLMAGAGTPGLTGGTTEAGLAVGAAGAAAEAWTAGAPGTAGAGGRAAGASTGLTAGTAPAAVVEAGAVGAGATEVGAAAGSTLGGGAGGLGKEAPGARRVTVGPVECRSFFFLKRSNAETRF